MIKETGKGSQRQRGANAQISRAVGHMEEFTSILC